MVANARSTSRMYEPVVELPVEVAKLLALASSPIWERCASPVSTVAAGIEAAGCERDAENGHVPAALEPAIPSVDAVTGAALAPSPATAALICV